LVEAPLTSAEGLPSTSPAQDAELSKDAPERVEETLVPEQAEGEAEAEAEAFYAETRRLVEATASPEVSSSGWKDISKPTAKVWWKSKTHPARDVVFMKIQSEDQVPKMSMLEMQEGKILSGAIPTAWAVKHWNMWFPFCDDVVMLRFFNPANMIVQVKLKVLFLTLDFVIYFAVKDLLASEGCIEIVLRSPPEGSEGQEWNGITVPPLPGSFPRVCIEYARIQARPKTMTSLDVSTQVEIVDMGAAPSWAKVFLFQQLAIRIVPQLVKFQDKIPGSALDKYLNSTIDAESRDFLHRIHKSVKDHVAGKAA